MTTKRRAAGKPFGPYEDFEACVADNQDKEDPEAYCAALEEAIETAESKVAEKRSIEDTRQKLENALTERFGEEDGRRIWVQTFDPDEGWVVFEMYSDDAFRLLKIDYEDGGGDDGILLSEEEPIEVERETSTRYVPKGRQRGELTGPIVLKDSKKRIAYAAVLVPGEPDSDGETLTAEKIEEVAHGWMESYRNIDVQHTLNNLDALPVESHILRQAENVTIDNEVVTLPKGTWVLASKFNDPATWIAIEKGKYTGYSVMGVQRAVVKNAAAKSQAFAFKKTLLKDLGDDWVATHVSVVDEPAVPKAKWFALKSATDNAERPSFAERLRNVFAPKIGRRFSDKTYKTLKAALDALSELVQEAEKERESTSNKQLGSERIGAKVVNIGPDELNAIKEQLKKG